MQWRSSSGWMPISGASNNGLGENHVQAATAGRRCTRNDIDPLRDE
jgi:hypothetical protein